MTADPLVPPDPKEAVSVFGHDRAQREFLAAYRSGRVHHAWLISGPSGIGKATLAWRLVKLMLYAYARPDAVGPECPDSASVLDVPADDPVFRRIVAGTEPTAYDLALGTDPKTGKLQKVISVNDVRQMKEFFSLTSADGMPIIAVVDSTDDMNSSGANAMLKLLEEPPENGFFFLVSHSPASLLPTIRSRCRRLVCQPLSSGDMRQALAQMGAGDNTALDLLIDLAEGSVGAAAELLASDGLQVLEHLQELLAGAPGLDRNRMNSFVARFEGRDPEFYPEFGLRILVLTVSRLARHCARNAADYTGGQAAEEALLRKLSKGRHSARIWAELHESFLTMVEQARLTNIDPVTTMLNMCLDLDTAAAQAAS